ncbi:unnamed protein product [Arabis nemorensis]|uniref:CTP synthase N-terminal domain-containing protein n=1 Tax=Arabis nemorensis TaxID=586526 RepID=A0A565ASG8_9BRAS|nr:unnamed protein product [Arabis nemorensis]
MHYSATNSSLLGYKLFIILRKRQSYPYLDPHAGTISPFEHVKLLFLDDRGKVDLNLENYERFLDIKLTRDSNINTEKSYLHVLAKERKWDYLAKTVREVAIIFVDGEEGPPDVCVIELGETIIGDIESAPFTVSEQRADADFRDHPTGGENDLSFQLPRASIYFISKPLLPRGSHAHDGSSQGIPVFLSLLLQGEKKRENQCKLDTLHALYNLCTYSPNNPTLLLSGIIKKRPSPGIDRFCLWIEKSLAVLLNLASSQEGREDRISSPRLMISRFLPCVLMHGKRIKRHKANTSGYCF